MSVIHTSAAPDLRTSLTVFWALVAIPVLYVVAKRPPVQTVQAGVAQQAAQDEGNSLSQLERRAKTEPTASNRINLSLAYIQNKMLGSAIDILTPLVAEMPENAAAWNNLCVARMLQFEFNWQLTRATAA